MHALAVMKLRIFIRICCRNGNLTQPLAKRVIIHGGAATSEYTVENNPSELFSQFVAETECVRNGSNESLACLQELDVEKLQEAGEKFIGEWKPAIDGVTVLRNPLTSIEFVRKLHINLNFPVAVSSVFNFCVTGIFLK